MSHEKQGGAIEYYTPKYIFDALECEFDLDVAAPIDRTHCHVPAKNFITQDSLSVEWCGFIWMNPPFGNMANKFLWLDKFFSHNNGIALTPDRTSAPWWQHSAKRADAVMFLDGKVKFVCEDGSIAGSPSNGTCLFASGGRAVKHLIKAQQNGLGTVLFK